MAAEDKLYRDPALADFYDLENGWREDMEFCARLAEGAGSVLDLGCGTGLFAAEMAVRGIAEVAGADPAAAMLAIARARPGGGNVRWVEADAREMRLGRAFDLIVMTGNAFQVFLTPGDRRAVAATIAAHLAPGGRFVFDSRNPEVEEWREWVPAASLRVLEHPEHGRVSAWNDVEQDAETGVVTYTTVYRVEATGRVLSARSEIAFPDRREIGAALASAGLEAERWFGNWTGVAYAPDAPGIVVVGRLGG
jgi:SAM-dependent methyltransferase